MSTRLVSSMTEDELKAVMRSAVREEFKDAGLRVEDDDDRDEAREDFRFMRKLRKGIDGASSKIGGAVIMAMVSGFLWLLYLGAQVFMAKPPP